MVTVYSTGCPKCNVLKMKLEQKGITYKEVVDIEQIVAMGLESVPQLEVDGQLLDFTQAIRYINER